MTSTEDVAVIAGADAKASALLSHDLAMLATATKYDLDDRADRRRSNVDLVEFFFTLMGIVGIDLFVEAGAKEAAASRRVHRRFPQARVVAFEANPLNYDQYAAENAGSGIEYLPLALTDAPGPVTFFLHRDEHGAAVANGQSSLLKRRFTREDRERGFEEVTVEGVTLDGFFADHDFDTCAMWIDVEGACRLVLGGAPTMLSRTAVAMIEVEDWNHWGEGHWLREQVVSHLYDFGLVPVARDYEYLHQHNIVFLRADLLRGPNTLRAQIARFTSKAVGPKASAPADPSPAAPSPAVPQPISSPVPQQSPLPAASPGAGQVAESTGTAAAPGPRTRRKPTIRRRFKRTLRKARRMRRRMKRKLRRRWHRLTGRAPVNAP